MTAVRPMAMEDWPAVLDIYRRGIETGNATFEAAPPTRETFEAGKLHLGRLVAVGDDGEQAGTVVRVADDLNLVLLVLPVATVGAGGGAQAKARLGASHV